MTGMLWLDDDKKTSFEDKVRKAAAYYLNKYGHKPSWCFVNPTMMSDETAVDGMPVKPRGSIQKHHLFLGGVGQ